MRAARIAIAFLALTLGTLLAPSPALANGATLIFAGTPDFEWAELNLLQEGRVMPTSIYPLTGQEFYMTVLREDLPPAPDVSNEIHVSLCPFYAGFDTPYTKFEDDMVYLHREIPPVIAVTDKFSVGNVIHLSLQLDHGATERLLYGKNSFAFWDINALNNLEFPREAYGVLSVPYADLAVGRFRSGIGHGYFGNTFLNGQATYYDQVQMSLYNKQFKFFYMLGTSATYLTPAEAIIQQSTTNWDPVSNSDGMRFDEPSKVFAYHRLEYRPADWITVGAGELNLIGGKTPDLMHINPFGFWHNTYTAGFSNVLFGMDASVVPFKGLHLFAELTVDDIRAGWGGEGESSKPTTLAWQVGARYVLPFKGDYRHVVGAEFTHADPWMYNRWQPYLIMYQRQVLGGGNTFVDLPLGYLYGGDLNHYGIYYSLATRDSLQASVSYDHLDKGPIDLGMIDSTGNPIYYNHTDWSGVTTGPWGHGTVEQRDTIALRLSYPLPWNLEVLASGRYTWIRNFGHQEGVQDSISFFSAGLRWSF